MLACMDEGIGNVTAALESKTMLSNMFIIFTTDNGGPVPGTPGGDYVGSRNYPLRGGKHSIWEGGTRGTALIWAGEKTVRQVLRICVFASCLVESLRIPN
jgi:arylsulfatase B